jgi:hypothetical protein
MARERKLQSIRSSNAADKKQANNAAESHNSTKEPTTTTTTKTNDNSHTDAISVSDEARKQEQTSTIEPEQEDTRTFQQLVQDYGDDGKCAPYLSCCPCIRSIKNWIGADLHIVLSLNELFHAQPRGDDQAEVKTDMDSGQ